MTEEGIVFVAEAQRPATISALASHRGRRSPPRCAGRPRNDLLEPSLGRWGHLEPAWRALRSLRDVPLRPTPRRVGDPLKREPITNLAIDLARLVPVKSPKGQAVIQLDAEIGHVQHGRGDGVPSRKTLAGGEIERGVTG